MVTGDPGGGKSTFVNLMLRLFECSGGAIGALIALSRRPDLSAGLGLDRASRVLVIGTEGATDPAIYRDHVGRAPEEVAT